MSDNEPQAIAKPWHFWPVTIFLLVWFGITCTDYLLTIPPADDYLRLTMTEAEIALFKQEPLMTWVIWAGAVWPNLVGAILMALRSRKAFWGFALGFPFDVFNYANIALAGNLLNYGAWGILWNNLLFFGGLLGLLYSRAMIRRGVLT